MVFKQKLPGAAPRQRTSARNLASKMGLELASVMEALQEIGEYVSTPTSNSLESPAVRQIYSYFGMSYEPETVVPPVSPWKIRDETPCSSIRRIPSKKTAPVRSNHPKMRFEPKDTSEGLDHPHHDAKPAWAFEEWKLYGFSDNERDAWISYGLRPGQARFAKHLRDAGLLATDLHVEVEGWSVAKRLRAAESPRDVFRLLQRVRGELEAS